MPNEIDGGPNVVKRTSVLCTNPPSTARAMNKKKKRLRVALSPAVPADQNGERAWVGGWAGGCGGGRGQHGTAHMRCTEAG